MLGLELAAAAQAGPPSTCSDLSLETLRGAVPAAAALPLLQALARGDKDRRIVLDLMPTLKLRVATHASGGVA